MKSSVFIDGLVWTVVIGPTVKIELRFQICPAKSGRSLRVENMMSTYVSDR